jgi:beta-galactosidase
MQCTIRLSARCDEPYSPGLMPKARISVRAAAPTSSVDTAKLAGRALQLGQHQEPLYSGAVHYFRLKPSAWRPALEGLRSLGLNMVETYVPWGVHELRDGSYDFGQYDPQKDLGAFLDLAHSLGLYAFVRPGPNINAELTYFGLPRRIVFDEACQARSSRGRPLPFIAPPRMFPVPSFASERFFHEVERWYAEAARIVTPRIWPQGPVVMVQVDNEASYYFRDAPYDQDHHPDALDKYREFLREKHSGLAELNRAHGTSYERWEDAMPPVGCAPDAEAPALRRSLELMEFQEELIARTLERLLGALREQFGDLPAVHNVAIGESGAPASLSRVARVVDLNGLDYYHRRSHLAAVKERTLRLVGSVRLPYAPEMGVGAPPWFAARTDADSLQTLLWACAYGVRGVNLYMAVDRDRWYGAPFDEMGRERPQAEPFRQVLHALRRTQFHKLSRKVEVGLMLPKEYARWSRATHALGAISPGLLAIMGAGPSAACLQTRFGFSAPIQIEWGRFVERFAQALSAAGVPYVYVESDAPRDRLDGLRVLISPTYEFAEPARLSSLLAFAQRGGRVLCGPRLPHLDEALRAFSVSPVSDPGALTRCDAEAAERVVAELIAELELATPFRATPASVETAVHEDASGARVLFVLQPSAANVEAEVQLPEPMALVDELSGERFEGQSSVLVPLTGQACRMFTCERAGGGARRSRAPSARRNQAPC